MLGFQKLDHGLGVRRTSWTYCIAFLQTLRISKIAAISKSVLAVLVTFCMYSASLFFVSNDNGDHNIFFIETLSFAAKVVRMKEDFAVFSCF
jgi:hypothetical protein